MKENIEKQIISKLIKSSDYITSKDLAFSLNTSEKTILKYLNNLKSELEENGAELNVKHGYGSKLIVNNQDKFNKFLAQFGTSEVPSTKQERQSYILTRLLNTKDYINIYDLADELYISPSLLRILLKDIITIIEKYNLQIDHSHNHGYRIVGNEDDIRRCLSKECSSSDKTNNLSAFKDIKQDIPGQISSIVANTLEKHHIAVSNEAINSLTLHFLIAINRNETKNYIDVDESVFKKIQSSPELYVIKNINKKLNNSFGISLPDVELVYLTQHLNGKQRLMAHEHLQVQIDTDALIFYNKFLRGIYQTSYYDFFEDEELRISLLNHIVPFINRVNNNNQITTSSLAGIKNEFPYAYELAVIGLSFLKENDVQVTAAEIGYFALHLALSMEKNKSSNSFSIAIISSEISGLYNMMNFKLSKRLENNALTIKYYNNEEANALDNETVNNYDLILNTTDQVYSFSNIMHVSTFLSEEELDNIVSYLNSSNDIEQYNLFNEKLFVKLDCNNKEDIIKKLIQCASKIYKTGDDLYDQIIERENMESTEYGNYIAIPHALKNVSNDQFIVVGKLNKAILWNKEKVQLVFLINLSEHKNISWFMNKISLAIAKDNISKSLIEKNDYKSFIEEFKKIN